MNLQVKIVGDIFTPSGKGIVLCDDEGNILPSQVEVRVTSGIDRSEITVTFMVDGENVRFVD